ncbi:transmembrane protein 216-like [Sycon ciliatum]|uniref:transmembrane protein 216-like n=1 Tax=Sycon ciliatum TaxID=27933 RepID=UPI0031F6500E
MNLCPDLTGGYRPVVATLSSLPLQMFFYFHGWFFGIGWICEILLLVYKTIVLPYPDRNLRGEIVFFIFLLFLELGRLFLGSQGNITQHKVPLIVSLLLCLPVLFSYLYIVLWQTYVLRVELIIGYWALAMLAMECVLAGHVLFKFICHDQVL